MKAGVANVETPLAAFQRDFAAALIDADGDAARNSPALRALVAQPGFAVYRNTVAAGCIDALADNFPTVRQLVGEEWFRAAAATYFRADPPRDARLVLYGDGFAAFLAGFAPARELPYLADVARFDRLWIEAHVAADAPPLDGAALAALPAEALAAARLVPHPAARWLWCTDSPAFTIWRRHREDADVSAELNWHAEGGLVVRPHDAVRWHGLGAGGVAFLDACAAGLDFAGAAERAEASGEPIGLLLPALVGAGAFAADLR